MSSLHVDHIHPTQVIDIWPYIESWVIESLGKDKSYTTNDIKRMCKTGEFGLWLISTDKLKGFFTCVLNIAPQGKTAYAPYLGGEDLQDWVAPAFDQFKIWLKAQGCMSFCWVGRKAWKRFLKVDSEQSFYLMNLED